MEQHPIPRDVTGFQFKLVGSMTLKQFGYVAGGAIIGSICFKAPLGFLRLPLTGLFWFLGFALAFIPIQERPLDRWLLAFLKSVYSPTQFVWRKIPPEIKILTHPSIPRETRAPPTSQYVESRKKLEKYLSTLPLPLEQQLDQKENAVLSRTLSLFKMRVEEKKPSPPPPQPVKKPSPPQKPVSLPPKRVKPIIPPPLKARKEGEEKKTPMERSFAYQKELEEKINDLKRRLELKSISRGRFLELSEELTKALEEKRRLEKELGTLRKRVEEKKEAVEPRLMAQREEKPRVKIITPRLAPKIGVPYVPQTPNTISGVIKDSGGRLLPGIIVSVKDKNGETVRALKTNTAGLFVSATPLPSGTYTLELEDPQKRFEFDIIKITLKGEVYSPLEILARGERERLRESLTKELFGKSFNF